MKWDSLTTDELEMLLAGMEALAKDALFRRMKSGMGCITYIIDDNSPLNQARAMFAEIQSELFRRNGVTHEDK